MIKIILISGILISLIIRIFFISISLHTADIYLMFNMGVAFLLGKNPYLVLDFNSYPPLALYLEAISLRLSEYFQLSFVTVFKIWPNLADFICAFLIYKYLIRLKTRLIHATLWAVFYLLNPVSLLISSAHGQLDSITSLFVVLSIFLITTSSKQYYLLSALSLGLAIAIKPNPTMLIPLFLLYKNTTLKQKFTYLTLILSPLIISFIPFLTDNPIYTFSRLFSYSGIGDISYAGVLRSLWYQNNAQTALPLNSEILSASKLIFLVAASSLILLLAGWKNIIKSCLIIYLLFLTVYFGIASQYLVWIIPLAVLQKDKRIFGFVSLGFFVLVSFYMFFAPDILLGKISHTPPYQTKYIYFYFLSNLLLWTFNAWWLVKLLHEPIKNTLPQLTTFRKNFIIIGFICFLLTLLPMVYLLNKLATLILQAVWI